MSIPRFAFLSFLLSVSATAQQPRVPPLRVIRTAPAESATPLAEITVSFDRPVAGSLDRSVDPATIFRVEPAIRGRLEWRDPVTIRLLPSSPLPAGERYTVTIANTFTAMDGSALAEPYKFTFRAQGPALLGGFPANPQTDASRLAPNQRFEIVYSRAADLAKLSSESFIEVSARCAGERIIRLNAGSQRPIRKDDPEAIQEAGGYDRDRSIDSLRRIVQLVPTTSLPRGCTAQLVVPEELDSQIAPKLARWPFSTYGDFRIEGASCYYADKFCPKGPIVIEFSNPVSASEVRRRVRILPEVAITLRDTTGESRKWTLDAKLAMHTTYAVVADTGLRDVFDQRLAGNPAVGYRTTGWAPSMVHPYGRLLVERAGYRSLSVQHVNIDTLIATIAPVPDTAEPRILSRFAWGTDSVWSALVKNGRTVRVPTRSTRDRAMVTAIRLPVSDARQPGVASLFAVKVNGRVAGSDSIVSNGPVSLVQITNLGLHARIGTNDGVVWVTGVDDGRPRAGAAVVLHDMKGRVLARSVTNNEGVARFASWKTTTAAEDEPSWRQDIEAYVTATLADDRAITVIRRYDPDLSPWTFNVRPAWDTDRLPLAGAVFTERGIYRPGERVYAKAIIRTGLLGALRASAGDSIKWIFRGRDEGDMEGEGEESKGVLRQRAAVLSSFGTASDSLLIPSTASPGWYRLEVTAKQQGRWVTAAQTSYRVAEYRPPEFLVDLTSPDVVRMPGDSLGATVSARYLFGAPMGLAEVAWNARLTSVYSWELQIPGFEDWYVGEEPSWAGGEEREETKEFASAIDTLDARGEKTLKLAIPEPPNGRAARVTLITEVRDVNRQTVAASTMTTVHPADFYIVAKVAGSTWFWQAGKAQTINLFAARPRGDTAVGVRIAGTIVRREWHRVRRMRDGVSELVGEWVSDTVARCTATSARSPQACTFTPAKGGIYSLTFTSQDARGRKALTSFERWVTGSDWVPWSDESQFKMDVVPDKKRYAVGDTANIMFASPFTNAEAWITVEREGLIEQRRVKITSGSTTLKFPITEAYAPNAFVSIIVVRGRSTPPGSLDDAGRPTMRVGYAELRVTPEVKRLTVTLEPSKTEFRPADSARVQIRVRDRQGKGVRSEVTLWAVDEGVLSLTGYKTPDPIDLIYRARGLGMRLSSDMVSVAPQIPEGEKGRREPGGGGGAAGADVLRSQFKTTAFFLASVVTDAQGSAVANAKLPDNLTTFRVMAVAVTAGDRYGNGESKMLVTRPLLARQALPRFVRPGDSFTAGAVINRRDGQPATVTVKAAVTGASLAGDAERTVTLAAGRGSEVRFPFRATSTDSASFRIDVAGNGDADAVRVTLPVRPDHHPRAQTIAGVLRDSETVEIPLPAGIDPARSRLSLNIGGSPLATIRGLAQSLRVYPYDCTEQVSSEAIPLIALYRVQRQTGTKLLPNDPRPEIIRAVSVLSRRQRSDGAIGFWGANDWSNAWLSAYAGHVLLEARSAGIPVDTAVLRKLADYLRTTARATQTAVTPVANWYTYSWATLGDQVAAADFLSRYGEPDVSLENELIRKAAQMSIEDRARLAELLVRRRQTTAARTLMAPTWRQIRVEGRRAEVPADSATAYFYFASRVRATARILTATLAVDPQNALIGPLVETLAGQARTARNDWMVTTQDYAFAANALATYDRVRRATGAATRTVTLRVGDRVVLAGAANAAGGGRDSTLALTELVTGGMLRATLSASSGDGLVYYYMTVIDVPLAPPVTPDDRGVRVERWYESYPAGNPVTSVVEGELVRVRLRVTVPTTRQFFVLDDALPAGLEAVDLSLRTASAVPGPGAKPPTEEEEHEEAQPGTGPWGWFGSWDAGWWSPFDHREIRDDRVVYGASILWPGTYTATYIARAATPGTFIKPPAFAEEMYNPGVNGRSDGGAFTVTPKR